MFRFGAQEYFYLLLALPLLWALYFWVKARHARRLERFGNPATVGQLMPEASWGKVRAKFVLLSLAVACLVLALARPQVGSKLREVKKRGVEIILAVDVSNSMLAEDFRPDRLERTKYAINRLLEKLVDDRVGLIVFAGDAFVQLPVTSDYVSARSFVDHVSTDMVETQGTSLTRALELALRSFSGESDKGSRAVVLISDGENHEGDPLPLAEEAAAKGILINAIGIGTPEGAPVVIGGETLKDEAGNIVVTKLDEALLQRLAVTTGGSYVRATPQDLGLDEIVRRVHELDKKEFRSRVFDEYNEQYGYFVGLALLFLLLEFVLLERKYRIFSRFNLFREKGGHVSGER